MYFRKSLLVTVKKKKHTQKKQFLPRKMKSLQQKEVTFTEFVKRITND